MRKVAVAEGFILYLIYLLDRKMNGVVLNCASPVTLGTGARDFNIVVPKGIYYAMKIKITAQDGKVIYLEGKSAVCINRSGITKVNVTLKADSFNNSFEVISDKMITFTPD